MTGMPEAQRREIAAIGAQFNDEINGRVRNMYAPHVPTTAPDVATALDLAYGEHPRQRLDAYFKSGGQGRRVLLYVPGGGFIAGDKRSDDKFYGNIGRWFAGQDVVVFTMNYRLAPEAVWPAGGCDVRDAVAYVRAHAAEYGGDPQKITIFGQSAGAAHVAAFLFHPEIRDENLSIASCVLASGTYEPPVENTPPNIKAYYGDDTSAYAYRAPISHVGTSKVPLLLTYAEFDPPFLALPTLQLAEAVTRRDGRSPKFLFLEHHNHVSNVLSFDTGDETLGRAILAFMENPR